MALHAPTDDVARYALDDPDAVVAAAYACPVCLHARCDVVLEPTGDLPVAACTCTTCAHAWTLRLGAHQLLRLTLDGPEAVTLTWRAQPARLPGALLAEDLDG